MDSHSSDSMPFHRNYSGSTGQSGAATAVSRFPDIFLHQKGDSVEEKRRQMMMEVCMPSRFEPVVSKNNNYHGGHSMVNREMSVTPDQECQQCGRCCEKWGWGQKGVVEDLIPWLDNARHDILQHVSITLPGGKRCLGSDIAGEDLATLVRIDYWVDTDGRRLSRCPFFHRAEDGKVYCRIHTAKPKVCTGFRPWNEGIRDYALNCPACRISAP